jgi:hypothetical protein
MTSHARYKQSHPGRLRLRKRLTGDVAPIQGTRNIRVTGAKAPAATFTPSSFNIGRAHLKITGQNHHIVQFRVTPDIVRETGSGSATAGSYVYRLKYVYASSTSTTGWRAARTPASACSRRRGSISATASTATGSRGPHSRIVKASSRHRTSAPRSPTTSADTATSTAASTMRQPQPPRGQRPACCGSITSTGPEHRDGARRSQPDDCRHRLLVSPPGCSVERAARRPRAGRQ